jgi:hypothetical protein
LKTLPLHTEYEVSISVGKFNAHPLYNLSDIFGEIVIESLKNIYHQDIIAQIENWSTQISNKYLKEIKIFF